MVTAGVGSRPLPDEETPLDLSAASRRVSLVLVASLVAALAVVGVGTAGLSAQDDPRDLVARLAEIDRGLPELPPARVAVSDQATWAGFPGAYREAGVALESVADPLQRLFEDASSADTAAADAVADASRGLLSLRRSYGLLARWEEADLEFPLAGTDDQRTATGADARYGTAEVGFRLLLEANRRWLAATRALIDSEELTDGQREILSRRLVRLEEFDRGVRPELRRALSLEVAHELRPVERFGSSAPGMQARARSFTLSCVAEEADADGVGEPSQPGERTPPEDCPTLEGAEVRPSPGQ